MLADPRCSRLVLINLARANLNAAPAEFAARWRESVRMLPLAFEILGVTLHAIGDRASGQLPDALIRSIALLDGDGLSLWRNEQFVASLAASNTGVVVLGGAYLEEDLFIAALEGVRLGYDMRVLADLSMARCEADRGFIFDRLALHGVLTTTVRQALLEWAVCLEDPALTRRIQDLLA